MPRFYDSKGNAHVLGEEIGRGGEGTVYYCQGNDELVAKIYYEPISDEKAEKLSLMLKNQNERILKVAAWVVETLHDKPNGKIVGFLMPRINAKDIHELYSLKSRRRHFPEATWHFLVHTSANLARAFYSLHKYSHVIGDINHGNCAVLADGTVKLIDCDSFAISDGNGNRYRCEVGVATHLPPELQKANLREVERTPEHDEFGLAVTIFQLLFLGRHPFAGNYLGEKDKTLEDCISEYRFAYGKNAEKRQVKQPPGTLNLSEVSPRVAKLFERAFSKTDDRPDPKEWIEALVDLSENLASCGVNPGHRFYKNLHSCPWCRIESQTGLMLFPFKFNVEESGNDDAFNIFTVEKLIENLGSQRNLPAKLEKPLALIKPEPSPEIIKSTAESRNQQFLYVGGYFIALIIFNVLFGIVLGTFFGIILMVALFSNLSKDSKTLQEDLLAQLRKAEFEWKKIESRWNVTTSPKMFAGDIKALKQKVVDYKNFQIKTNKELNRIENTHKHRELTDYLRTFRIANSEIKGVSESRRERLVEKKVWTAAEVEKQRLTDYYGVNSIVANKLVKWRNNLEKDFSYDADSPKLKERKTKFLEKNTIERKKIEQVIKNSVEKLRKDSVELEKGQKMLVPKSEEISKEIAQHKSNLSAVGDTSMALASLILITFLVPLIGITINTTNTSPPRPAPRQITSDEVFETSPPTSNGILEIKYPSAKDYLSAEEYNSLKIPKKDITPEEIKNLSIEKQLEYSNNLVRQAIYLVKMSGYKTEKEVNLETFEEAKEKYNFAERIDKENNLAFEQYAITLFDRHYFEESLKQFKKLEKSLEDDTSIQIYIGRIYLKLEKFIKARDIFLEKQGDYSINYFYLGLAYKGLKQYKAAANAFEKEIKLGINNPETIYELGYISFKLNDKESFNKQYSKLLEINPEKAKQLLNVSYKLPPSETELRKIKESSRESAPVISTDRSVDSGGGSRY